MKGWKINQLIAIHTIVSACAGIALAVILFLGFLKLEHKQLQIADEAIILKDVLRMEEAYRQWLVMMDLVLGNEQTYLATGAQRQADFFLSLVEFIGRNSIADSVQNDIEKISILTNSITKTLDSIIEGEIIGSNAIIEFDAQSAIMLELIFNIKNSIQAHAQDNIVLLARQRSQTIVLSIGFGFLFIIFIAAQWILLALYLVRPVQKLSKAVALAQQEQHHFQYRNDAGPIEIKGLAADFLFFINRLEELAEHAQKSNIAKSDFLSTMSHEIRTPLNAIIGFSDMLRETQLSQEQSEYSTIIYQSGNSLLTLINDILDFSKIEAGKMQVDLLWFDMYDLLTTVLASNRHACKRKSLSLEHNIDSSLPRYLYGDEQKIRQILYNLLNNALKFTEQGSISLNVKTEQISPDSCVVNISVIDTGIGIAKEKQAGLFDSFTQEDASTTRKYGGTGLGLAIVDKMVTLLGGEISLHSEQGRGTEFSLRLPFALNSPEADESYIEPTMIALIGENNNILSLQLSQLGYVVETMSFEMCLTLLQQQAVISKYHLLLFSHACKDQAISWYESDLYSNQRLPAAYCLDSFQDHDKTQYLSGMPAIKISEDGLDIVEQLNRLIKTDLYAIDYDAFLDVGKILVVEDNPVNLLMTQKILNQTGLNSIAASNGQQAIDLYQSNEFAMILMDCQMPVMDGFKATQEIRFLESNKLENDKDEHIPIVALTANAFQEERDVCLAAGMDDFISKPFKKKQLIDIIGKWLKIERNESKIIESGNTDSTEDILDMTIINELMDMDATGSTEFISQISHVFFSNTEQVFQQIEVALLDHSFDQVAKYAHQLKSSSMHVAATRLSDLFSLLETLINQGQHHELVKLWQAIIDEYHLVEKAYKVILNNSTNRSTGNA